MLSSRRTRAIPHDFLQALHAHQLTLDSLLPHLDPPVPPSKSQKALEFEVQKIDAQSEHVMSLGHLINGVSERMSSTQVPRHFPVLPSRHAYKATSCFTSHEQDPRKARERATEESRLAEEALRKLAGTGSNRVLGKESFSKADIRKRGNDLWKETMEAVTTDKGLAHENHFLYDSEQMDVDSRAKDSSIRQDFYGSTVNADRVYWRKPTNAVGIKGSVDGNGIR